MPLAGALFKPFFGASCPDTLMLLSSFCPGRNCERSFHGGMEGLELDRIPKCIS